MLARRHRQGEAWTDWRALSCNRLGCRPGQVAFIGSCHSHGVGTRIVVSVRSSSKILYRTVAPIEDRRIDVIFGVATDAGSANGQRHLSALGRQRQ